MKIPSMTKTTAVIKTLSIALGLTAVATTCAGPALDDVFWTCETQADCLEGYTCATSVGYCLKPDNSEAGVESDRITIGFSGQLSSGSTEVSKAFKTGIEALFAEVTNQGGIDGRSLELLAADDGGQPTRVESNMSGMIANGLVFAFLGNTGSNTALSSSSVAVDRERILFGPRSSIAGLYKTPPSRYVFNYRPSLKDELSAAINYVTTNRELNIPTKNIAVFVESERVDSMLTQFGTDVSTAVKDIVAELGGTATVPECRYNKNQVDTDYAVTAALAWLAAGIDANPTNANERVALFVLGSDARAGAAFVADMLDEFHKIKRDASSEFADALSVEQIDTIKTVTNLLFLAPSEVGGDIIGTDMEAQGTYTALGNVEKPYCHQLLVGQVVPDYNLDATGVIAFRNALSDFDVTEPPSHIAMEGYVTAKLFVEALKKTSPIINSEVVIDALEQMDRADLGMGEVYDFGQSDHQAVNTIFLSRYSESCALEALETVNIN